MMPCFPHPITSVVEGVVEFHPKLIWSPFSAENMAGEKKSERIMEQKADYRRDLIIVDWKSHVPYDKIGVACLIGSISGGCG